MARLGIEKQSIITRINTDEMITYHTLLAPLVVSESLAALQSTTILIGENGSKEGADQRASSSSPTSASQSILYPEAIFERRSVCENREGAKDSR
jgi:hypothetical protein